MSENNLDDIWGSDSDIDNDQQSHDFKKLRETHNNRGYMDGITNSKDANLQEGFDAGFPTGATLGLHVGKIIGTLQGLQLIHGTKDASLREDFELAKVELQINKVLTKTHFDNKLDLGYEHVVVNKWQIIMETYSQKYLNLEN